MRRTAVDATDALRKMHRLEESLKEEIPKAIESEAERGRDNVKDILRNESTNPSSASGEAERSLTVEQTGKNQFSVLGNAYLNLVETGTEPHAPDIDHRLIIWASQEGWEVTEIANHIKEHGTESHPFKKRAFDPVKKLLPERVASHLRRNVDIS